MEPWQMEKVDYLRNPSCFSVSYTQVESIPFRCCREGTSLVSFP